MNDNDIKKLILFGVKHFSLKLTVSMEDFIHEVRVNLFLKCKKELTPPVVVNWVKWTHWKLNNPRRKSLKIEHNDCDVVVEESTNTVDDLDLIENIYKTPDLTPQEQAVLSLFKLDLTQKEIGKRIGVNYRQRIGQIQKALITKILMANEGI